jgi:ABC-type Mn2+/Zn2+ transport system permease subunit
LSYHLDVSSGAAIVLTSFLAFLAVFFTSGRTARLRTSTAHAH